MATTSSSSSTSKRGPILSTSNNGNNNNIDSSSNQQPSLYDTSVSSVSDRDLHGKSFTSSTTATSMTSSMMSQQQQQQQQQRNNNSRDSSRDGVSNNNRYQSYQQQQQQQQPSTPSTPTQRHGNRQGPPRLTQSMDDEYNNRHYYPYYYAESDPGMATPTRLQQHAEMSSSSSSSPKSSPSTAGQYYRQRIEQHQQFQRSRRVQQEQQQAGPPSGQQRPPPPPISYSYSSNDIPQQQSPQQHPQHPPQLSPRQLSPRNLRRLAEQNAVGHHGDQQGQGRLEHHHHHQYPKTSFPYPKIEYASSDIGPIRTSTSFGAAAGAAGDMKNNNNPRRLHHLPGTNSSNSSSNKYNDNTAVIVETPAKMNVKELRNQLWNDQEVLKVPQHHHHQHEEEQSDKASTPSSSPPIAVPRQQQQQPPPRHLAPMIRQYGSYDDSMKRGSSSNVDVGRHEPTTAEAFSDVGIDLGGSNSTHNNSNGKFHSKFYEAALAARMRGKIGGREEVAKIAASHSWRQDDDHPRQERIDPDDEGEQDYPTVDDRPSRGRSIGPSSRRSREPSPMIQERIRSFSQDPSGSSRSSFHRQEQNEQANVRTTIDGRNRNRDSATSRGVLGASREAFHGKNPPGATSESYGVNPAVGESFRDSDINDSGHVTEHSMLHNSQSSRGMQLSQYRASAGLSLSSPPRSHSTPSWQGQKPSRPRPPTNSENIYDRMRDEKLGGVAISQDKESDDSSKKLSTLVAKLSSVNRANPEEALAQIDSILRQESVINGSGEEEKDRSKQAANLYQQALWNSRNHDFVRRDQGQVKAKGGDHGEIDDDDDDDDDDDSDVSSITNPTYQDHKKQDQVRVVLHNEWMHPKGYQNDLHHHREGVAKIGAHPSTSSFRRPRPSHLPNYATHGTSHGDDVGKSGQTGSKRRQLKNPPPPQISVKDPMAPSKVPDDRKPSGENWTNTSAYGQLGECKASIRHSGDRIEDNYNYKVTQNEAEDIQDTFRRHSNVEKRRESLENKEAVADKLELSQKIRIWDSISQDVHSKAPPAGKDEPIYKSVSPKPPPPPGSGTRNHPWDGKLPKNHMQEIDVRNTSMSGEVGIETEIQARARNASSKNGGFAGKETDPAFSDSSLRPSRRSQRSEPFQSSRKIFKERSEGYLPVDPTYDVATEEKKVEERTSFHDLKPHLDETVNSSQNSIMEQDVNNEEGIPQFDPRLSEPRTMTLGDFEAPANDHDTSGPWVPLPPSSFFPETDQNLEPVLPTSPQSTSGFGKDFEVAETTDNESSKNNISSSSASGSNSRGSRRSMPPSTNRTRYDDQFNYPSSNTPIIAQSTPSKSNSSLRRVGPPSSGPVDLDDSVRASVSTHTGRASRLVPRVGPPRSGPVDLDDSVRASVSTHTGRASRLAPRVSSKEEGTDTDFQDTSNPEEDVGGSGLNGLSENNAIEVSLVDANQYKLDSSTERSRLISPPDEGAKRMSCMTPIRSDSWGKPREKRRGLLRAFMEKSKNRKKRGGGSAATTGHAMSSVTNQSASSHASVSAASSGSARGRSSAPPKPTLRLIPPPPGVLDQDQGRSVTPTRGRGTMWNDRKTTRSSSTSATSRKTDNRMARAMELINKYYEDE